MVKDLEIAPVPHLRAQVVTNSPSEKAVPIADDLIIQSDAAPGVPSASDTYLNAMPAPVPGNTEADVLRRSSQRAGQVNQMGQVNRVEWNVGTSGRPKLGSRSLRLCLGNPNYVAERVPLIPQQVLLVGGDSLLDDRDDLLKWSATLPLRRSVVPVELCLRRFNARLTLAEIRITGQRHYPRRFFATAHGALAYLEAERFGPC